MAKKPRKPKRSNTQKSPKKRPVMHGASKSTLDPGKKYFLHIEGGIPNTEKVHTMLRGNEWTELRVDPEPEHNPDFIGSLLDLSAVPDNSVSGVWFSHRLQRIPFAKAREALKSLQRVMMPDALLLTVVADAHLAVEHLFNNYYEDPLPNTEPPVPAQEVLYGPDGSYQSCYSAPVLGRLLLEAGYENVQVSRSHTHVWAGAGYQPAQRNQHYDKVQVNDHHQAHKGPPDDQAMALQPLPFDNSNKRDADKERKDTIAAIRKKLAS